MALRRAGSQRAFHGAGARETSGWPPREVQARSGPARVAGGAHPAHAGRWSSGASGSARAAGRLVGSDRESVGSRAGKRDAHGRWSSPPASAVGSSPSASRRLWNVFRNPCSMAIPPTGAGAWIPGEGAGAGTDQRYPRASHKTAYVADPGGIRGRDSGR